MQPSRNTPALGTFSVRLARLRWCGIVAALWLTGFLAGCSTVRNVESTVQSYSAITALPEPHTFRIEPLPSQQGDAQFSVIAGMTCTALQHVGLRPSATEPAIIVTIQTQAGYTPGAWPYDVHPWFAGGFYHRRGGISARTLLRDDPPRLYRRSITILMRDTRSQKVIYETSATHEDIWTQDPAIYQTLAQAALQGFPTPATSTRQISLPLYAAVDSAATKQHALPATTAPPASQTPKTTEAAGC